jgi:hypothetical protein
MHLRKETPLISSSSSLSLFPLFTKTSHKSKEPLHLVRLLPLDPGGDQSTKDPMLLLFPLQSKVLFWFLEP